MKKMCPFLLSSENLASACEGQKCAWFDEVSGRCAVLLVGQYVQMAAAVLDATVADDGGVCVHVVRDGDDDQVQSGTVLSTDSDVGTLNWGEVINAGALD